MRSSRRLAAEAGRNLELIWLSRGVRPDFRTIADFRRDNRNAFKAVFRDFVVLCRKLDLFGRELLAVDGTRLKAVNSRSRNFSRERLATATDARLERYLAELDQIDHGEDGVGTPPNWPSYGPSGRHQGADVGKYPRFCDSAADVPVEPSRITFSDGLEGRPGSPEGSQMGGVLGWRPDC